MQSSGGSWGVWGLPNRGRLLGVQGRRQLPVVALWGEFLQVGSRPGRRLLPSRRRLTAGVADARCRRGCLRRPGCLPRIRRSADGRDLRLRTAAGETGPPGAVTPAAAATERRRRRARSAQERLWFLEEMLRGSGVYDMPLGVRIRGPLDMPHSLRACATIERATCAAHAFSTDEAGRPCRSSRRLAELEVRVSTSAGCRSRGGARRLVDELARSRSTSIVDPRRARGFSPGGRGARARARLPPHRLRRLVARRCSCASSAPSTTPTPGRGRSLPSRASSTPTSRWQRQSSPSRRSMKATRLLARAARGRPAGARAAH